MFGMLDYKFSFMKRFLFSAIVALCVSASAVAQDYNDFFQFRPDKKARKNYINISYVSDEIKLSDKDAGVDGTGKSAESNWAVSLTYVHTYMLHKRPIARMMGVGLDVGFFDATYSNYTIDNMDEWGMVDPDDFDATHDPSKRIDVPMHKVEYSLQVGPSITVTPGKNFTFSAYARYAPTFTGLYIEYNFYGNYASMFNLGASVAWKNIGVGIETRTGVGCRYKDFTGGEDLMVSKLRTSGFRAFLQIRW